MAEVDTEGYNYEDDEEQEEISLPDGEPPTSPHAQHTHNTRTTHAHNAPQRVTDGLLNSFGAGPWACPVCTFVNYDAPYKCDVCDSSRSAKRA
jgi:rubrerythrin